MHIFKRFRDFAGISQSDLAREFGVTKAAVSHWESGAREVNPSLAHRFIAIAGQRGFETTLEDVYPKK